MKAHAVLLLLAFCAAADAYVTQPAPGTVYWGAAVGYNADPVARHETPTGTSLALHRSYYQWDQRDVAWMKNNLADDQARKRLPWVSFKTPAWAEMASGLHDAEIDQLLTNLKNTGKPIWLTIWHEPENDLSFGTPADHVGMNRRVRQRMTALNVKNVALVPNLMAWSWTAASGRDPDQWWSDGIFDLLSVDIYQDSEKSLLTSNWYEVRAWAKTKNVDLAVGEWGMRGSDSAAGQRVHDWYEEAIRSATDGKGSRVVGLSAFDSGANSPTGSWELTGEQLTAFHALMRDPRSVHVPEPTGAALLIVAAALARRSRHSSDRAACGSCPLSR